MRTRHRLRTLHQLRTLLACGAVLQLTSLLAVEALVPKRHYLFREGAFKKNEGEDGEHDLVVSRGDEADLNLVPGTALCHNLPGCFVKGSPQMTLKSGDLKKLDFAGKAWSVCMWLGHMKKAKSMHMPFFPFFSWTDSTASGGNGLYSGYHTTETYIFSTAGRNGGYNNVAHAVDLADSWKHYCFAVDYAGDTMKVFLDGVEQQTALPASTSVDGKPRPFLGDADTWIQVGSSNSITFTDFSGRIGDWRLYDLALTEAQAAAIRDERLNPTCTYAQAETCEPNEVCHVTGPAYSDFECVCDAGFSYDSGTSSCVTCPANSDSAVGAACTCNAGYTNFDANDGCLCGDGLVNGDEDCDDGNTASLDGCSSTCVRETLCDLARSCGAQGDSLCSDALLEAARQSTYWDYADVKETNLLDDSPGTCAKTADAKLDPNPQWVRVALGSERLVGTVRFRAPGSSSDYTVAVAAQDATVPADEPLAQGENPSVGATVPGNAEACAVNATGDAGVLEAHCPAATKGAFVFIRRSAPKTVLEVCDVEVYQHSCVADAAPGCPRGTEPSGCESCRGCVPCAAGFYSDLDGPYQCTPCPGRPRPYSPPGSTSVFQCEGDAVLDSTSTLAVEKVSFSTARDAWVVDVAFSQGPSVQVNGLSTLYMSHGGAAVEDAGFAAAAFPCRADASEAAGGDLSASLSETVCCLQDMRDGYLMTKIFRNFTDGLDLVAANDECDADDASDLLVNNDLEVVGSGTEFVGVDGSSFTNKITVEPLAAQGRRSYYEGMQYARITIPDAELYKVSRSLNPNDELTDTRELFIGLLDMLPTGTRVVDSAHQQIAISLTRTQYGTFAAYGEQNIDYDFISYLNARAHKVISTTEEDEKRRALYPDQHYLEVTYVYDNRLSVADEALPVESLATVALSIAETTTYPCNSALPDGFVAVVEDQDCGPTELNFADGNQCPQVSIPKDKFGRIYIPLPEDPNTDTVSVSFQLNLTDSLGKAAELTVAMDIVVSDFVSWCDANEGSIDLAERVIPSITIGTESENPPRLTVFGGDDPEDFNTGAETLQDGLITLELSLNETNDLDDNLEVFMEDVLVIQINPGSTTTAQAIKADGGVYVPSYTYNPDTRDATLHIPDELKAACSNMSHSESFFGCVYKHVLAEEEITNPEWAYKVGSEAPTSAQDFMETMLGDGTAAVAARQLGRDYEAALLGDGFATRKKIGLWINPGHVWGQTVHNSKYSLSQDVVIYVLFGVRSGVDGTERRMLLQAGSDGRSAIMQTIKYEVTAASLMESVMEDVVAVEVKARMALPADDACAAPEELRAACSQRLRAAVEPHASTVAMVQCVAVTVEDEGGCDGARRASAADVTVAADAVIALDSTDVSSERGVFLDIDAVVESGSVLTMAQVAGRTFEPVGTANGGGTGNGATTTDTDGGEEGAGGVNVVLIAGAAGAAAVVMVLAFVAKWALCGGRREAAPLTEVVAAGVVPEEVPKLEKPPSLDKGEVENMLFGALPAFAREEQGDVTLDSLLPRSRPGTQAEFRPLQ